MLDHHALHSAPPTRADSRVPSLTWPKRVLMFGALHRDRETRPLCLHRKHLPQSHGRRYVSRSRSGNSVTSTVSSAGVGAIHGQPPSSHAIEVLRPLGIDISRQRSQPLTDELVEQATHIFVMTRGHLETIQPRFSRGRRQDLPRSANSTPEKTARLLMCPIRSAWESTPTFNVATHQTRAAQPSAVRAAILT